MSVHFFLLSQGYKRKEGGSIASFLNVNPQTHNMG